jgi:hypothetical protein
MSKIKDPYLTQFYQHYDLAKIMGGFFGWIFLFIPWYYFNLRLVNALITFFTQISAHEKNTLTNLEGFNFSINVQFDLVIDHSHTLGLVSSINNPSKYYNEFFWKHGAKEGVENHHDYCRLPIWIISLRLLEWQYHSRLLLIMERL